MSKVNDYLLANPKKIVVVFKEIFGKYLIRYYDQAKDYQVLYSEDTETSYHIGEDKIICISANNINELLKLGVPVLSVAYHELFHVLYTKISTRDDIERKAYDYLVKNHKDICGIDTNLSHTYESLKRKKLLQIRIHEIWNVLEDARIEKLGVIEYPFLKTQMENLSNIIRQDGRLMNWRKGEPCDQELQNLADLFVEDKIPNYKKAEIIAKILLGWYPFEEMIIYKQEQTEEDSTTLSCVGEETEGDTQEGDTQEEDTQEEDTQEEDTQEEDTQEEDTQEEDESDDENFTRKQGGQKVDKDDDETLEGHTNKSMELSAYHTLRAMQEILDKEKNEIENLEDQDGIKSILLKENEILQKQETKRLYEESIFKDKGTDYSDILPYISKIKNVYNMKQKIIKGKTAAQAKGYSMNITRKMSISRLLETKLNKKPPKIFYGKGKDTTFLGKVCVFEDISASTKYFSKVFSSIAKTLVDGFYTSEWWLYGSLLMKKPPIFYNYNSYRFASQHRLDHYTKTEKLLNVMRYYQDQDNLYIIITDGDMGNFFYTDLYKKFNDKLIFVGILDYQIKKHAKYYVDLCDLIQGYLSNTPENSEKFLEMAIVETAKKVETLIFDKINRG